MIIKLDTCREGQNRPTTRWPFVSFTLLGRLIRLRLRELRGQRVRESEVIVIRREKSFGQVEQVVILSDEPRKQTPLLVDTSKLTAYECS